MRATCLVVLSPAAGIAVINASVKAVCPRSVLYLYKYKYKPWPRFS